MRPETRRKRHGAGTIAVTATSGWWGLHRKRRPHQPGPYEVAACVSGTCRYSCVEGAVNCGGTCTFLGSDPDNCGACGYVCSGPYPSCYQGVCGNCVPNCPDGWCGGDGCGGECSCPSGFVCGETGWCVGGDEPCPGGETRCNGVCTDVMWDANNCGACGVVCPPQFGCAWGVCEGTGL